MLRASIIIAISFISCAISGGETDRATRQAQLDMACEEARERKLAPERNEYIEECIRNNVKDSREACERFYRDYGARTGFREPLYYDLPECVDAFEYRKSYRQSR